MDNSGSAVSAADALTPDERAELNRFHDRVAACESLSDDETTRRQDLMLKASPESSPELRKKLEEHDRRFAAAYAALNRRDHEAVETFLAEIAPPPRADIDRLESHINTALGLTRKRPRALAPRRSAGTRSTARPRQRRPSRRARARAPGRQADGGPEPPLALGRP
jgi:hypothetical protein